MTVAEILNKVGIPLGGGVLVVLLGLIKIDTWSCNLWQKIIKEIGKAFNAPALIAIKDIKKDVEEVSDNLNTHIEDEERKYITNLRQRILRFCDDITAKPIPREHSKEYYAEILSNIDTYQKYCESHRDFENGRTKLTIEVINKKYSDHLLNGGFADDDYEMTSR